MSLEQEDILPPEVFEALPEKLRPKTIQAASFKGPLPYPVILSKYEEVYPGLAERLVKMAENNQNHRISWENRALKGSWMQLGVASGWAL